MKKWWTSKTVWANLLMGVLAFFDEIQGLNILDPEHKIAVIAVINLVLRFITTKGLK